MEAVHQLIFLAFLAEEAGNQGRERQGMDGRDKEKNRHFLLPHLDGSFDKAAMYCGTRYVLYIFVSDLREVT
jgi:hypothetical protein